MSCVNGLVSWSRCCSVITWLWTNPSRINARDESIATSPPSPNRPKQPQSENAYPNTCSGASRFLRKF